MFEPIYRSPTTHNKYYGAIVAINSRPPCIGATEMLVRRTFVVTQRGSRRAPVALVGLGTQICLSAPGSRGFGGHRTPITAALRDLTSWTLRLRYEDIISMYNSFMVSDTAFCTYTIVTEETSAAAQNPPHQQNGITLI